MVKKLNCGLFVMMPCSLVAEYQNFKVKYCLILEGTLSCWLIKGKPSNYTNWTLSKILGYIMATIISIGLLLLATWQNKNIMRVTNICYARVWLKEMDSYTYTNILQWHFTSNNIILHNTVYGCLYSANFM
jgi:hypothetical protein